MPLLILLVADGTVRGRVVLPVTVQTGAHLQGLPGLRLHDRHLGNIAVTHGAGLTDRQRKRHRRFIANGQGNRPGFTLGQEANVGFVYKPHVVGQSVHPFPIDGVAIVELVHHPLDFRQINVGGGYQVPLVNLFVAELTCLFGHC